MAKYRKKPIVVEAEQWFKHGDLPDVDRLFEKGVINEKKCDVCGGLLIHHGYIDTLEGGHLVCPGDWRITGIKGERYNCKDSIFRLTYEFVND